MIWRVKILFLGGPSELARPIHFPLHSRLLFWRYGTFWQAFFYFWKCMSSFLSLTVIYKLNKSSKINLFFYHFINFITWTIASLNFLSKRDMNWIINFKHWVFIANKILPSYYLIHKQKLENKMRDKIS